MTGTKAGTVTVTATADGKSGSITVTVKDVVGDYTYQSAAIEGSESNVKITIWFNGKDVTSQVATIRNAQNITIGRYVSTYAAFVIDKADLSKLDNIVLKSDKSVHKVTAE